MTHNHLVPGSSPGGTTLKPSKSLTMRVFVFLTFLSEPFSEPKSILNRFLVFYNGGVILKRRYLIDRMKIKFKDFSFRKGESRDIPELESCRINSIKNCKIYSIKQINIWINSKPNWEELIPKTIVSVTENHISGFVISGDKFLDYLYVEPNYQRHGLGNKLVSLVETTNMKCDCNPYSEKILIKRGWKFLSENIKEKSGERFNNKWYKFEKIEKSPSMVPLGLEPGLRS